MRNWGTGRCREEEKKRPNARKTIWLHRLMDASWALSLTSLSAFLFLSLSPSLPSLRLFLQTRWQHQSKQKSRSVMWCVRARHTHTHKHEPVGTYGNTATSSPQKRFIRFEQQRLVLMRGAVMMICFLQSLFFYGWHRQGVMLMKAALLLPLITQSNTKRQQNESCISLFGTSWSMESRTFCGVKFQPQWGLSIDHMLWNQ